MKNVEVIAVDKKECHWVMFFCSRSLSFQKKGTTNITERFEMSQKKIKITERFEMSHVSIQKDKKKCHVWFWGKSWLEVFFFKIKVGLKFVVH